MEENVRHADLDVIISLVTSPALGADIESEAHVAACERCYGVYSVLRAAATAAADASRGTVAADCAEDWELAALVRVDCPALKAARIKAHIAACGPCAGRAATYYYAAEISPDLLMDAPAEWRERALGRMGGRNASSASFIGRVLHCARESMASRWAVPSCVVAAAFLVIAVALVNVGTGRGGRAVVIRQTEKMTVRDSEVPVSMGFMGSSGETVGFQAMTIGIGRGTITFMWKGIEGNAEGLTIKDKETRQPVARAAMAGPGRAVIDRAGFESGRLFSWELYGRTPEDRYFEHSGDFLLAED